MTDEQIRIECLRFAVGVATARLTPSEVVPLAQKFYDFVTAASRGLLSDQKLKAA